MENRFKSGCATRNRFEAADLQHRALSVIPSSCAETVGVSKLPLEDGVDDDTKERLMLELMRWYKEDFFEWVNGLKCEGCGKEMKCASRGEPLSGEEQEGLAGVVEVHACEDCQIWQRFPRYNHPGKLLETRKGRCGEWANCFGLIARAVGFEVRYISDWTDHVWIEVYNKGKWTHLDACEGPGAFDKPLLYEQGWGKKLNYIVAFGPDHVVDVSKKYSKNYVENMLPQRTLIPENQFKALVRKYHTQQQGGANTKPTGTTLKRLLFEQFDMLNAHNESNVPLDGRVSGSEEWRRARGELGK